MMDFIKALDLPIYQHLDQYEKIIHWDGPGRPVNIQFSRTTDDETGSQMHFKDTVYKYEKTQQGIINNQFRGWF